MSKKTTKKKKQPRLGVNLSALLLIADGALVMLVLDRDDSTARKSPLEWIFGGERPAGRFVPQTARAIKAAAATTSK